MNAVNQANFNFIWKNKTHYIKKENVVKYFRQGGLKAIDFYCLNGMIKVNWLKAFLKNSDAFWYCIPTQLFSRVGGLPFLLLCDFTISKLPIKLSDFHQQVLLYWKLIYKHNFTPHSSPIWNNRYITLSRKSVFYREWKEKNIWSIMDMMNRDCTILSYSDFCLRYNFAPPKRVFYNLIRAIPKSLLHFLII